MDFSNAAKAPAGGVLGMNDISELQKALSASYGTDMAGLEGGGALRLQSLDKTLMAVVQENKHFKLFNTLAKGNAIATVDEWTEQSSIGGFPGGTANAESGDIKQAQGEYARRTAQVKYMMTRCEVTMVQASQTTQVGSVDVENVNGTKRLLTDAEYLCFEGDAGVVDTEFDGIHAQMLTLGSASHIIDAAGSALSSINLVADAAATLGSFGNFGTPTDIFFSMKTQADFDKDLDPAFRVPLNEVSDAGTKIGSPVSGIRTSNGDIKTCSDVFIFDEDRMMPFDELYPSVAADNLARKPASATPVASTGSASSKFGATHGGNYYYGVAGVSQDGQSGAVVTSQVVIAAGDKVTLTIAASAGGTETGYAIYRGRKNGTNATSDLRLVKRIPKTGSSTVFVDENDDIPGTSKAYVMDLSAGSHAINWQQMLPLTKFPLYPTASAVIPWALLMFGYLRVAKRQQIVVIKNILPNGTLWRPFG